MEQTTENIVQNPENSETKNGDVEGVTKQNK